MVAPLSPHAAPRGGSDSEFESAAILEIALAHGGVQQRHTLAAADLNVAVGDKRYGFASLRRLKTPAEFSALLRAPRDRSIRAARSMLSINAAWVTTAMGGDTAGCVRFGVTVGKRNARRSVDRALIKRIVRESCRHYAGAFEGCAAQALTRIDIALRLKSPLVDAHSAPLSMRVWRHQVRADADELLQEVLTHVSRRLSPRAN